MKLSPAQVVNIKNALKYSSTQDVDGKPDVNYYPLKDALAARWFNKNTEKAMTDYSAKVEEKRKALTEKYKTDLDEESAALKSVRALLADLKAKDFENKEDYEKALESINNILKVRAASRIVESELISAMLPIFNEEEDIEVQENTKDLIKRAYAGKKFAPDDTVSMDICEKFGVE